jgi:hypothetical protein
MSIRISEKHGVNPSLMLCHLCGESMGVALLGRMKGDVEAPRQGVFDYEPCDKCKAHMKDGIILLQVKDDDPEYRLGGFVVMKEEAFHRIFNTEVPKRVALIANEVWQQLFGNGEAAECLKN